MLPKKIQLQNRTLTIQMPVSIVSWFGKAPSVREPAAPWWLDELREKVPGPSPAGVGIMSGSRPMRTAEPTRPTAAESQNPGLERSIMYQRNGFAKAKVMETCIVDAHGSLRYREKQVSEPEGESPS